MTAPVKWVEYKVAWEVSGTYLLTLHPDEAQGMTPEDVAQYVEENAGDLKLMDRSEIDGLTILEVDDKHVHSLYDPGEKVRAILGMPVGSRRCSTCSATVEVMP